jgi:hypothetical protein
VQQNELNNRLKWAADHVRHGDGEIATMRDAVTTQALNKLRDQLQEIQKAAGNVQPDHDKDRQALEQALAQAEHLRQQMERAMRAGQQGQKSGQQPGQRQAQAGQQNGTQGAQPGDQGEQGQAGQTGPRSNGREGGGLMPGAGPAWGDAGDMIRNYRHTLHELENNPQVGKDLRDTIHDMYRLDPQLSPGNPELLNRIEAQMLSGVEQIELQLRRALDQQGGTVRSDPSEPVPPGYADAVAEYFRRLSKEK